MILLLLVTVMPDQSSLHAVLLKQNETALL